MHRYLLHNTQIHETTDRLLSPGQVGFMNGWGVFSTLLVWDGVLFAYERHYRRMQRDAALMHVRLDVSEDRLKSLLYELIQANRVKEATLRVSFVRNKGGLFEAPGLVRDTELVAFTADRNNWGAGVKLMSVPNARYSASPFAGTKVTSWGQNLTWYEMAHQNGYDEMLLLNERGQVSECTSANVFVVQGTNVWTPPLGTSGCLPGVTRAILLEEIRVPGVQIAERELTPAELEQCDAAFITSTTRDLLPVFEVDGLSVSRDSAVVDMLRTAFVKYRESYTARHRQCNEVAAI